MYSGNIQDKKWMKNIDNELVRNISSESNSPLFYDIHVFAKNLKLKSVKKTEEILAKVKELDKDASLTHIRKNCIKTKIDVETFKKLL